MDQRTLIQLTKTMKKLYPLTDTKSVMLDAQKILEEMPKELEKNVEEFAYGKPFSNIKYKGITLNEILEDAEIPSWEPIRSHGIINAFRTIIMYKDEEDEFFQGLLFFPGNPLSIM